MQMHLNQNEVQFGPFYTLQNMKVDLLFSLMKLLLLRYIVGCTYFSNSLLVWPTSCTPGLGGLFVCVDSMCVCGYEIMTTYCSAHDPILLGV